MSAMKRRPLILAALVIGLMGAALVSAFVSGVAAHTDASPKVLTIKQILVHPQAYVGRVVLLRGTAAGFSTPDSCTAAQAAATAICSPLILSDSSGGHLYLRLGHNPYLQMLRSIPVLGRLVPPPQQFGSAPSVVYRIHLMVVPPPCTRVCLYGEFLDSGD